ncbi:MAG: polysaccharide biosynthesis/export protein [Blastocatellia bacterium]|nr:polysaccharide biosynthesis/export protein [Blastocatellia bacterium]
MSKKTLIIFASVFSLGALFTVLALAQSPQTVQSAQSVSPDLQASAMDNQGIRRYRVGPGDLLDVRVFGQPDLTSTVEIDEDGNVSSLPFVEDPIPAKCRNEKEIQKAITDVYSRYLIKPRVSVRILERRSRPPAVIFGAVRAPTRVQMMRRVRLHELLALSGGITSGASGTIQIMHTEAEMCPEPEDPAQQMIAANQKSEPDQKAAVVPNSATPDIGQLEVYQINTIKTGGVGLNTVSVGGLGADPFIRPGDVVIVTEGLPIYITGGVVQPGPVTLKDQMTLLRAIAMAGGIQRLAKGSQIHIYRQKEGKIGQDDLKVNYDAIKNGKQPDILLQAYDIIDVRMLNQFSPKSLGDFFLNMSRSSMGILPTRAIY